MRHAVVLVALLGSVSTAGAQEFKIEDVSSARSVPLAQLRPGIIVFSDQEGGAASDEAAKLVHFDDWAHTRPIQRKFLALFPGYVEPTVTKEVKGEQKTAAAADPKTDPKTDPKIDATAGPKADTKAGLKPDPKADSKTDSKTETGPVVEKLYMYVAQARFVLDRPPSAVDLSRYVTLPFLERIDPAIKHKVIAAADVGPNKNLQAANHNPARRWCESVGTVVCIESSYKLEGKLPLGIALVNKLKEHGKKYADTIEFQSELRVVPKAEIDDAGYRKLTGVDSPIAGALEQNIVHVNQVMQFGKLLAVFQQHPSDSNATVVTAFMVLGVESDLFEKKKEYAETPVLRNLIPAQVISGNSTFNTGNSISAGLPNYARNQLKAIAEILEKD